LHNEHRIIALESITFEGFFVVQNPVILCHFRRLKWCKNVDFLTGKQADKTHFSRLKTGKIIHKSA